MKYYIAGKITGNKDYKYDFFTAEQKLITQGHKVMNPAELGEGFTWQEYMIVCKSMLQVCEAVYFLKNWEESDGAMLEHTWALSLNKKIMYEED